MKAKGIAEKSIINSGIPYTIIRTGAVFGAGDQFTEPLARLLRISPGFTLIPEEGKTLLQPIAVEDLVTCMILAMEDPMKLNRTIPIGGIESISYFEIIRLIMKQLGISRRLISVTRSDYGGFLSIWLRCIETFRYPSSGLMNSPLTESPAWMSSHANLD
jgi:NADH dehydrogenase